MSKNMVKIDLLLTPSSNWEEINNLKLGTKPHFFTFSECYRGKGAKEFYYPKLSDNCVGTSKVFKKDGKLYIQYSVTYPAKEFFDAQLMDDSKFDVDKLENVVKTLKLANYSKDKELGLNFELSLGTSKQRTECDLDIVKQEYKFI